MGWREKKSRRQQRKAADDGDKSQAAVAAALNRLEIDSEAGKRFVNGTGNGDGGGEGGWMGRSDERVSLLQRERRERRPLAGYVPARVSNHAASPAQPSRSVAVQSAAERADLRGSLLATLHSSQRQATEATGAKPNREWAVG